MDGIALEPLPKQQPWLEHVDSGGAFSTSQTPAASVHHESRPSTPPASPVSISAIGTALAALSYLSGGIFVPVFRKYAYLTKHIAFAGLLIAVASLLAASFANGVPALIALQGVGAGLGAGLAFTPVLLLLPQWFDKKRGFASGLIFSGSTLGGITFPFLFQATLSQLGWRWSLRIYAGLMVGSGGACKREIEVGYFLQAATVFVLSAGYLSISLYISLYIETAGMSTTAIGQLILGHACDRLPYPLVTMVVGTVSSLSALLLFGLSTSISAIVVFIVLFGISAGGFTATWAASCGDVARIRNTQTSSILMSYGAIKGVASLIGPLIAAALLEQSQQGAAPGKAVFGSYGYAALIIWVGSCMAATAALGGTRHTAPHPRSDHQHVSGPPGYCTLALSDEGQGEGLTCSQIAVKSVRTGQRNVIVFPSRCQYNQQQQGRPRRPSVSLVYLEASTDYRSRRCGFLAHLQMPMGGERFHQQASKQTTFSSWLSILLCLIHSRIPPLDSKCSSSSSMSFSSPWPLAAAWLPTTQQITSRDVSMEVVSAMNQFQPVLQKYYSVINAVQSEAEVTTVLTNLNNDLKPLVSKLQSLAADLKSSKNTKRGMDLEKAVMRLKTEFNTELPRIFDIVQHLTTDLGLSSITDLVIVLAPPVLAHCCRSGPAALPGPGLLEPRQPLLTGVVAPSAGLVLHLDGDPIQKFGLDTRALNTLIGQLGLVNDFDQLAQTLSSN
ncbi:MFS general substrate transporter [Tilletiaria anomala UBC 951]|uniref:MFS general substrate transporter n=1 Tax=Tilletiaria anomala (strain ATCC 24038 / CBS 436.72 / UBC 951) TaxID=1037660 RepID=A0A066V3C0_TILAU|nr:MFS general substrate transporter [Tilletiaria anomala UBC 951]KDN35921.1 MFS general substrate transporter [Tilletiaria anomala UBC 951]